MPKATPSEAHTTHHPVTTWRDALREVVFESDRRASRYFNAAMLVCILISVTAIMLETVAWVNARHGGLLRGIEWAFTLLFTAEYITRLAVAKKPLRYATSFFGIVDLFAIAPTWAMLLIPGAQELLVIRSLRLVRLFRILKLAEYVGESAHLLAAFKASRPKIVVFLVALLTIVVILGAVMHLVEGPEHGFTSIPISMYWAITTLTTVGYGDLAPGTAFGKALASIIMIMGYGMLAVPTGIVTTELAMTARSKAAPNRPVCATCGVGGHTADAVFCRFCGTRL